MKWVSLIVALIVGGFLAYQLFLAPPPAGTSKAVADAYLRAALKGDSAAIGALCADTAREGAVQTAAQIRATNQPVYAFSLQRMKPQLREAEDAFVAVASGKLLGIELARVNGKWKVLSAQMSDQ